MGMDLRQGQGSGDKRLAMGPHIAGSTCLLGIRQVILQTYRLACHLANDSDHLRNATTHQG